MDVRRFVPLGTIEEENETINDQDRGHDDDQMYLLDPM